MSTHRTKGVIALVALAIGAGAILLALRDANGERQTDATASAPSMRTSVTPANGAVPEAHTVASPTELWEREAALWPRNGQSIADRWALLAPIAEAGNSRAACRLALELLECERGRRQNVPSPRDARSDAANDLTLLVHLPEHIEQWRRDASDLRPDLPADVQANREQNRRRWQAAARPQPEQCGGLDAMRASAAPRWLREASRAGERDAQAAYVALADRWLTTPGALVDPEFARWRDSVNAVAGSLLDARDPRAPGLIADLHRDIGYAGAVFDGDHLRAVAARRVHAWLSMPQRGGTRPAADPNEPAMSALEAERVDAKTAAMAALYADREVDPQRVFMADRVGLPGRDCGFAEARR